MKQMNIDELRMDLQNYMQCGVYEERADEDATLPYIVLVGFGDTTMHADNWIYKHRVPTNIHLLSYQANDSKSHQRDEAEMKLEAYLRSVGIPYSKERDWDNDVQLWNTEYGITLMYG